MESFCSSRTRFALISDGRNPVSCPFFPFEFPEPPGVDGDGDGDGDADGNDVRRTLLGLSPGVDEEPRAHLLPWENEREKVAWCSSPETVAWCSSPETVALCSSLALRE